MRLDYDPHPNPTRMIIPTDELWSQYYHTRSLKLCNQLARKNDKLALKIAHRMSGQCAESIEDLSQIARIGLLKAIERFDPNAGVAFSSFAVPYIRGEILHFMRDHFGSVKIPRRAYEELGLVRRLCFKMQAMGRDVDILLVAEACGISEEKWQWLVEATQRKQLACIDDQHDLTEDDDSEAIDRHHDCERLKTAIAYLPRLKRQCVEEHWFGGMSEASIARKHNMPLQQVQGLLNEALDQLKAQLMGV